jgi:hypothetical protein
MTNELSSKSRVEARLKPLYGKTITLLKLEKIVRSIPHTFIQSHNFGWNPYHRPNFMTDNTLIKVSNVSEQTGIETSYIQPRIYTAVVEIEEVR